MKVSSSLSKICSLRVTSKGTMGYTPDKTVSCQYTPLFILNVLFISAFPEIDGPWSQVLDTAKTLMRNAQLPVPVWAVLSAYIYESNPFLEDLRVTNNSQPNARSWPCARITRPLRRRWYGVLLFERRDVDRLVVEWCAESLRSYVRPKLVRPNYPLGKFILSVLICILYLRIYNYKTVVFNYL